MLDQTLAAVAVVEVTIPQITGVAMVVQEL
jgi:hypothetical protein